MNKKSITADKPPTAAANRPQPVFKNGRIPLTTLFDKIYESVASKDARAIAPQELQQLKTSLDTALKQIDAISKKMSPTNQPK